MIGILTNNDDLDCIHFNLINDRYKLIKFEENENIITLIKLYDIKCVIFDLSIPDIDFIISVKLIKKYNINIKIIITINFFNESLIRLLYDNGVDYILVKPLDEEMLLSLFNKLFDNILVNDIYTSSKEKNLIDVLNSLGMPANLKGYSYIKEAINLCSKNKNYYLHTTSCLYPKLSKIFKIKETCIEKAIRSAIELCWIRGNVEEQEKIFGYTVNRNKGRPTNGEFLAQIYNYLTML